MYVNKQSESPIKASFLAPVSESVLSVEATSPPISEFRAATATSVGLTW